MYINDHPNCLREASPRMFADDTNITLTAKTLTELKLALTPELSNLNCWLRANRLSLNVAKTELMIIGSRQRLNTQCDEVDIRIDGEIIKRVDRTKSLGLTIDDRLSWSNHVDEIRRKVSSAIGALKRIRQNRAARIITKLPFDRSSNLLLDTLKWEKLSLRRKKTESTNYV